MNTNRIGRTLVRTTLVAVAALALAACFENSPVDELTPDGTLDIDGTWSGVVTTSYYCEATHDTLEFSVSGLDVTVTGGSLLPIDTTGSLTEQSTGRYSVSFDYDGGLPGLLIFNAGGEYATLVTEELFNSSEGQLAVLQKAALPDPLPSKSESDLVGDWAGTGVRLDSAYSITESYGSSATIASGDGLYISTGEDQDGTFSTGQGDVILANSIGIFASPTPVAWATSDDYYALYALSYNNDILAVAFLTDLCNSPNFDATNLPNQKFALWQRQP